MTKDIHVVLERGVIPNKKIWEKANTLLLKEIKDAKRSSSHVLECFCFYDFMYCVFFIFEKVGIKEIIDDHHMIDCLQNLYYENQKKRNEKYPAEIFSNVFSNPGGPCGGYASIAESFRMDMLGKISCWTYGHGNVIKLGQSDDLSKNQQRFFENRFHEACKVMKRRKNKKFIPKIIPIAQDLFEAMRKG